MNKSESADKGDTSKLDSVEIKPICFAAARNLLATHHYLHSFPGGTQLAFGVTLNKTLLGAVTFGAGPYLAYKLVEDASPDDCLSLTRLWLSDELPRNSESYVIGRLMRNLRRLTILKFLVTYADPSAGHLGIIYQATNWIYTGLSSATPLYDLGDGITYHSRSLAQKFGSRSIKYLESNGLGVKLVDQSAKHRYLKFLDKSWQHRLKVRPQPYPKGEPAK